MDLNVHSVSLLIHAAGIALANRDAATLEDLQRLSVGWLQSEHEASGQRVMLLAMTEACYMLEGEPSELEFAGQSSG